MLQHEEITISVPNDKDNSSIPMKCRILKKYVTGKADVQILEHPEFLRKDRYGNFDQLFKKNYLFGQVMTISRM